MERVLLASVSKTSKRGVHLRWGVDPSPAQVSEVQEACRGASGF